MSWSYSLELVAEFLEANCLDTEQLQPSNLTPTPDQFYSHGKPTEHSRISRFGMTCEPLTDDLGTELLTWYRAGFPVKTYQSQEKAQDLTESDQACGEKWRGWLAKFDQDSCSWKTAQLSLLGDSVGLSVIFPRSGMTRGGLLWELPMLEPHTSGTGYGYWPTPNACTASNATNLQKSGDGRTKPNKLGWAVAVQIWPTPVASDTSSRNKPYAQGGTPLSLAVKQWPTPTAHNAKETNAPSESGRNTPTLAAQAGGPLNPEWVEWLMGWPIGHTALKPSETDKSRNVEQQHGKSSEVHE